MGERFAFVTKKEINLLVDKPVPENNNALNVFDGKLFVNEMLKYSSSYLRHFLLIWALFNSPWNKNVVKLKNMKGEKF